MDKLSSENKFAIMPEWVIELDISHTAFRLYAVLARYADNVTHQAFPSLDTLANRLGCGEKTVRRAIEDLVEHGAIKKHSRGRYQSSLYTVMTTPPKGTKLSGEGSKMSHEGSKMSTRLDKNVQVTITTELEPLEREPKNDIGAFTPDELQIHFADFWEAYPLKRGKGAAAKAYEKAIEKVAPDYLLDRTRKFRDDPHRPDDFTPLCTTWLNQERWDDEPYKKRDKDKTNSEKNVENLRSAMALLGNDMKEVESEQIRNESAIDFGVNFRSAQDI
jgi:biotin operon repressor